MGFSYNVNVLNQKGSPALYTDTFANRPAFGYKGRLFIANDTSAIYEDTGTAWVLIANVSSGAGTLQQVTTNGNTSNVGISVTAGGISTNSLTDTALTLGSVLFSGAAGLVTQDNAAFFWDDTNNRLGLNTITPSNTLDVHFAGSGASIGINNTAGNPATIVFANTGTNKWRMGNSTSNSFDIINVPLGNNAISINTATSNVSFIESIKISQSSSVFATAGYNSIFAYSNGFGFQLGISTISPTFAFNSLTASRNYVFPDAAGTIALTSDLSAYLPLTGGTLTNKLNIISTNTNYASSLATAYSNSQFRLQPNSITGAGFSFGLISTNILYIQTQHADSITTDPLTLNPYGGSILLGSTTDDTVNKLQVTGSSKFNYNFNGTGGLTVLNSNAGTSTTAATIFNNGSSVFAYIGIGGTNRSAYVNIGANILYTYTDNAAGMSFLVDANGPMSFGTNSVERINISNAGVTKITNLAGTGSRAVLADASGNLSAPVSDISVKQNIEPLKYGLKTILQLNAVQFEFIESYKNYGEGLQIGAIAQEIELIIPEAVFTTPLTGLKGINYNQLNGIYIKAIQEQQKIIESLIQRIEILENK